MSGPLRREFERYMKRRKMFYLAVMLSMFFFQLHSCSVPAEESLISSAKSGDVSAVKMFLSKGADINTRDSEGWTPLTVAACKGHYEVVKILVNHGADVNIEGPMDLSALTLICLRKESPDLETINFLLAHGAEIDPVPPDAFTPLLAAISRGHKEIAQKLLEKGADPTAKRAGWTPVALAKDGGDWDVVQLLMKAAADRAADRIKENHHEKKGGNIVEKGDNDH